jgi:hypothetical protein
LKLVNDEQRAGNRFRAPCPLVACQILRPQLAEQIAAPTQLVIHPLQHAQAKFAVAFDGHHAGVRQTSAAVAFELDALLKIHQVELHLLRTAPESQVSDDDVEQRGFARTGFAGNQRVLARAAANFKILKFRRAGTANRRPQEFRGFLPPHFPVPGGDRFKRHLDPAGILAQFADALEKIGGKVRWRRRVQE